MSLAPVVASGGANLERATVLVLDADETSMGITTQILAGFGAKNILRCESEQSAMRFAATVEIDMVIVDASSRTQECCEFIAWMRRDLNGKNQFTPTLVITAYTQLSRVTAARNAGANFVVAKPLTPMMFLHRIQWLARDQREYVNCATYVGPDRRFKFQGPPAGMEGRRATDLKGDLGDAKEPNMSQSDIDALMQPTRVAI